MAPSSCNSPADTPGTGTRLSEIAAPHVIIFNLHHTIANGSRQNGHPYKFMHLSLRDEISYPPKCRYLG